MNIKNISIAILIVISMSISAIGTENNQDIAIEGRTITEAVHTENISDYVSDIEGGIGAIWSPNQFPVIFAGSPAVVRGNVASVGTTGIRINLFMRRSDGKLWERYWNGANWVWANTGLSVAGNPVILARGNLASVDGTVIRINLFVRGTDGKLWERFWDGSNWIWADTGKSIVSDPVILVRGNVGSVNNAAIRINLFVRGTDGKLWERFWDGSNWIWADTGLPVLVASNPIILVRGNVGSVDGTEIRINLFVKGSDGKWWERFWDGSNWIWVNRG